MVVAEKTADLTFLPPVAQTGNFIMDPVIAGMIKGMMESMDVRLELFDKYESYYIGVQGTSLASAKFRSDFGYLFRTPFSANWCQVVVDAVEERSIVQGFRFGDGMEDSEDQWKELDDTAWAIWKHNNLDAGSSMCHTESLVKGVGYVLVSPGDPYPMITPEDGAQCIVTHEAGTGRRMAGLKRWVDTFGFQNVTLYLPDRIEKYVTARPIRLEAGKTPTVTWGVNSLVPRVVEGESWPLAHSLGVVPLVAFPNRPRLAATPDGLSELESLLPLQDAVNKELLDLLVASEFAAFRQRWATGLEIPVDPVTGQQLEPFKTAVDRLWVVEPTGTGDEPKFGEFSATDLVPYVKAVELLVQQVASITRTPAHYLLAGQTVLPSGETLRSSEAGLVAKTRRKHLFWGNAWVDVMKMALSLAGKNIEKLAGETTWMDPEMKAEGAHIDALSKLLTIGVPPEQLWLDAGYTPAQVERFKTLNEEAEAKAEAKAKELQDQMMAQGANVNNPDGSVSKNAPPSVQKTPPKTPPKGGKPNA